MLRLSRAITWIPSLPSLWNPPVIFTCSALSLSLLPTSLSSPQLGYLTTSSSSLIFLSMSPFLPFLTVSFDPLIILFSRFFLTVSKINFETFTNSLGWDRPGCRCSLWSSTYAALNWTCTFFPYIFNYWKHAIFQNFLSGIFCLSFFYVNTKIIIQDYFFFIAQIIWIQIKKWSQRWVRFLFNYNSLSKHEINLYLIEKFAKNVKEKN